MLPDMDRFFALRGDCAGPTFSGHRLELTGAITIINRRTLPARDKNVSAELRIYHPTVKKP